MRCDAHDSADKTGGEDKICAECILQLELADQNFRAWHVGALSTVVNQACWSEYDLGLDLHVVTRTEIDSTWFMAC